ncbi:MAG: hypothetical protein P8Y23_00945 [Candidatus Lokiarchaeota archaeon]|jgi:hypothetical protein
MEFSYDIIKEVKLIKTENETDIYDGTENLRFEMRHPIFKALMKLEFEDIIRNYYKRINPK